MTPTDPVADYLERLDDALRDVPFGTAREIRAGVAEELGALGTDAARARIAELGDPTVIAAAAAADQAAAPVTVSSAPPAPPSGYGRGAGYVAVTALLIGVGGLVLPVVGWIAGLVALWTGRVWTTFERWIATLAPVVASALVVGILWAAQPTSEPSPNPSLGFVGVSWTVWLGASVGSVVIGIWLAIVGMRRVRG